MNEVNLRIEDALRRLGLSVCQAQPESGADLLIDMPDGHEGQAVLVQVKRRTAVMTPSEVEAFRSRHPFGTILALPYITTGLAGRLRAAGVDYVDSAGNAHIERPGMLIHVEGRRLRTPAPAQPNSPRPGPAALKVLFAVLVRQELVNAPFASLAEIAGVAKGTVHNTMFDLAERGLLTGQRRTRRLLDRPGVEQLWVDGYATTLLPTLAQQRATGPGPDWWQGAPAVDGGDLILSGGPALVQLGAPLRPDTTILYGVPPWVRARQAGKLSTQESHTNIVLRERFWSPELTPRTRFVPPLLVYADALSGTDPREVEAARDLHDQGLLNQ